MKKYNWDERNIITMEQKDVILHTNDLHVWYGDNEAIKGVDLQFEKKVFIKTSCLSVTLIFSLIFFDIFF